MNQFLGGGGLFTPTVLGLLEAKRPMYVEEFCYYVLNICLKCPYISKYLQVVFQIIPSILKLVLKLEMCQGVPMASWW